MSFKTKRVLAATASAAVATLFLAGCAPADNGVAAGCEAYADYQGFEGTEVEVYTTIIAPEADLFVESFAEFEECTGITVNWNGTQEFEAQIAVRVEGGTAPDLAIFPQPGLLARFKDSLVAAPAKVSESVDANYSPDWKNYGTVDGTFFAAPLGANVKSFVWYNPKVFADNNYTIPTTWQELLDLSEQIATEGKIQPWCAGFGSGEATGWVGTDWMEDIMLRTASAETYDKWTTHGIPFNDPAVATAIGEAGKILKNPKYVGDVASIATTTFQDGGAGIVDGSCAMHRQASFIGGILAADYGATIVEPSDTSMDNGISVFYFPGTSADNKPALGGGEFVAAFADRGEVAALQHYLTTPLWNNAKAT